MHFKIGSMGNNEDQYRESLSMDIAAAIYKNDSKYNRNTTNISIKEVEPPSDQLIKGVSRSIKIESEIGFK